MLSCLAWLPTHITDIITLYELIVSIFVSRCTSWRGGSSSRSTCQRPRGNIWPRLSTWRPRRWKSGFKTTGTSANVRPRRSRWLNKVPRYKRAQLFQTLHITLSFKTSNHSSKVYQILFLISSFNTFLFIYCIQYTTQLLKTEYIVFIVNFVWGVSRFYFILIKYLYLELFSMIQSIFP